MVIGKIKPSATLVAQFPAGVEVDAIQHEGRIFMPVVSMGEFATTEEPAPKKDEPAPSKSAASASEDKSTKKSSDKTYTEDELMEMDTKALLKMCKEMGIDPDATEGKNTNKKLRTLILSAQEEGGDDDGNEETEETSASEENSELVEQVGEILEDFDAGKKNKKKAISAIVALGEDVDADAVTDLVNGFEDDADADIDDVAKKIADVVSGVEAESEEEEEEEEDEKPAKKSPKKGGKKEPKEELVDVDDLEVGDRVSVYWDDENKDWFDGKVKSIKKGKVVIAYDDDTEEPIDPEVHTKIKRLAE